jgi:hypothetical protein
VGLEGQLEPPCQSTRIKKNTAMAHQSDTEKHVQTYRPTSVKVSCYSEVSTNYLPGHFLSPIIHLLAVYVNLKQGELKNALISFMHIGRRYENSAGAFFKNPYLVSPLAILICSYNDV